MADQLIEDRQFVIFDCSELYMIDFTQVMETSYDTVRKSIDKLKTFVKYEGPMPTSVQSLTTKSQEYTYSEILVILSTTEWTDPMPINV